MPTVLGYLVALSRRNGWQLPSFPDVYDTAEEAEAELGRLEGIVRLLPGDRLLVLELHQRADG